MTKKKNKMKKSFRFLMVFCFLLIVLLGIYFCFFLKKKEVIINEKPEEPTVKIVNPKDTTRPVAVMINNFDVARPFHSGLQSAYLMYEMIVEGGITRYMALFSNQTTERIGPIRSARHYYIDYAMENDAVYVHWGYSDEAKKDLKKYQIENVNGMYQDSYFWKDKTLKVASEHTAFSSMELVNNALKNLNYRTKRNNNYLLSYQVKPVDFSTNEESLIANNVSIPYSKGTTTSYTYDETLKTYQRFVNSKPHVDYVTKEQYTVKNIITYKVKNTTIPGDSSGRQNINTVGNGTGYYITDGLAIPIKWEKKSREAQTKYTYMDGTNLVVNDGNTFIQIQPESQKLSIS